MQAPAGTPHSTAATTATRSSRSTESRTFSTVPYRLVLATKSSTRSGLRSVHSMARCLMATLAMRPTRKPIRRPETAAPSAPPTPSAPVSFVRPERKWVGSSSRMSTAMGRSTPTIGPSSEIRIRSLRGAWISAARVYLQADNLLTFTKYEGLDPALPAPEIFGSAGDIRDQYLGVDRGAYPSNRIFSIGVVTSF